jgi:hypothetical protein
VNRLVARFAYQRRYFVITQRGHRRRIREPNDPVPVSHPDRLGDAVQDRGYEGVSAGCPADAVSSRRSLLADAGRTAASGHNVRKVSPGNPTLRRSAPQDQIRSEDAADT